MPWLEAIIFFYLYIYFWRARLCWPLLSLCRPFCIFETCLDSNPESCRNKQPCYHQLTHLSHYFAGYGPGGGREAGVRLDDDLLGVLRPLQPRLLRLLVPLLLLLRLSHLRHSKMKTEAITISDNWYDPCGGGAVPGDLYIWFVFRTWLIFRLGNSWFVLQSWCDGKDTDKI